jgi:hypothetical protein
MSYNIELGEPSSYEQQFAAILNEWKENLRAFFARAFSIPNYLELRKLALFGYLTQPLGEVSPFIIACIRKGIVVPSELNYAKRMYTGDFSDLECLPGISEKPFCEGQIVSTAEAIEKMKLRRNRGGRVVASFGNFDVGHEGQRTAIAEFVNATQLFGELTVFVGSDESVRARKGPGRPYQPQIERMSFVAAQPGVAYVAPLNLEFNQPDELEGLYDGFHQRLAGVAHMRAVGDRNEAAVNTYLEQCNKAGILLVYSDVPRISSATQEGKKL